MSLTLSIVVPMYNSSATIGRLIDEIAKLPVEGGHELVLVNDASPDHTLEVVEAVMRDPPLPITLVKLSRNYTEHNAVMAGLHHVTGDYVITMDDDLQNPPLEALKLLNYAREHGHEVVYSYYDEKRHESWRNMGSWLTNRVADVLLDKPKGLYLSSFRCMTAFLCREITRYDGPFAYVDGLILQVTQDIGRVKVLHAAREVGRSGYTMKKLVLLWLNMFVNFSVTPLRISTLFGLLMAGLGFLWTLVVILERLFVGTPLGWSSLMAALLVFSGTQLLMLGMLGEYVGRIYLTVNKQPQFVVKEVIRAGGAAHRDSLSADTPF